MARSAKHICFIGFVLMFAIAFTSAYSFSQTTWARTPMAAAAATIRIVIVKRPMADISRQGIHNLLVPAARMYGYLSSMPVEVLIHHVLYQELWGSDPHSSEGGVVLHAMDF
jgi:hypothetical protein